MGDLTNFLVFVVIAACFVYWAISRNKIGPANRAADHDARQQFTAFMEQLQRTGEIPVQEDVALVKQPNEFIALRHPQATMLEYRTARLTGGVGTRVKIAGIPVYFGGAKSRPADELRKVAVGTVYLTNKRFAFFGDARTYAIGIDDILSIENGHDWIRIQSGGRAKPAVFTVPNGYFWEGMFRVLREFRPETPRFGEHATRPPVEAGQDSPFPHAIRGRSKSSDAYVPDEEIPAADKPSLQMVFRRYLESKTLSGPVRSVAELIASGSLSRESFDKLMRTGLRAPNLKETLLDLTLVAAREFVKDHELSNTEIADLDTLITTFRIEEGEFYRHRRDDVQEVLTTQTMWMLQDRYVTEQEEILQRNLQRLFGLSYDQYVALLRPLVRKYIEELESKKLVMQDWKESRSIDLCIQNLRGVFLVPQ